MKLYYVYILKLNNNDYYVGYTENLKRRLQEHKLGQQRTTKNYLPVKFVTYLAFSDKISAINFEIYLKTGSGIAFRKRHLL